MAEDIYGGAPPNLVQGPGAFYKAIVPSDAIPLENVTRYIYVGGAGNVAVRGQNGTAVTFTAPPVGSFLPIRATHVLATGTTATNLIAIW